jgi:hypothetical protein
MPLEFPDLGPELLDLRLEAPELLGERLDGALLLVRVGRPVESLPPEIFFKEPEECVWPLEPSLMDMKGHPSRQVRRHVRSPPGGKIGGIKRRSAIVPTSDAVISPVSPFLACFYVISEQIPSTAKFVKFSLRDMSVWKAE